jgi:hypothetical protein
MKGIYNENRNTARAGAISGRNKLAVDEQKESVNGEIHLLRFFFLSMSASDGELHC